MSCEDEEEEEREREGGTCRERETAKWVWVENRKRNVVTGAPIRVIRVYQGYSCHSDY